MNDTAPSLKPIPGLVWSKHPIVDLRVPPLTEAEAIALAAKTGSGQAVLEYWKSHEAMVNEAVEDPLRKGFELPFWSDFRQLLAGRDELYALGGNGPGKTELGGKIVVECLCSEAGKKVLCVSQNDNASKQLQQPAVYKYLPTNARGLNERLGPRRRSMITKMNYSQGGGFTEGTFVLPNRGQCWFKTVEQWERDNTSFEGPEYDLVWIDEPAPIGLVDTLSYRVGKRRGKFLFTFTAVNGFDSVCNRVLTGARVVKSLPMNWMWNNRLGRERLLPVLPIEERGAVDPAVEIPELKMTDRQVDGCPPGHMPFIMQPLNPAQGLIFLWTQWNVFLPRSQKNPAVPSVFDKCVGKSGSTVRTRLFGWAEKISGCQFPQFNTSVHVVDQVPEESWENSTAYMAADPAIARSYFLLWVCVDKQGRKFIFDESPRWSEGEWVNTEEEAGEGAYMYAGMGVNFYKEHIRAREAEHAKEAVRRKGDPRAFATQAAAAAGGTSLFELFQNEGNTDAQGPMFFEPAKVRATIQLDIEKVNDELSYDDRRPISIENEPRLYIHRRCQNLIRSILNWSPDQGSTSPWKDPIDALRYLFDEPLYYLDPTIPEIAGGRGW